MKLILFLLIVLVSTSSVCAQDTICVKDGSSILAKVVEIDDSGIKYQRADLSNGPIYFIGKERVTKICYNGGGVDIFWSDPSLYTDLLVGRSFVQPVRTYQDLILRIDRLETRRRRLAVWSNILSISGMLECVSGIICFGSSSGRHDDWEDEREVLNWTGTLLCVEGGICLCIGGILANKKRNTKKELAAIRAAHVYGMNFDLGGKQLQLTADILNDTRYRQSGAGLGVSLTF